ncbi:MAG: TetR/AcrR family transcriptional regulator [Caulobacteraceae bacterium]
MPRTNAKSSAPKPPPALGKPTETYEKLITAASDLLNEVDFERLSTNMICAKAGLTPPAFYRYFRDKYDILEVLARRLLKRQADAQALWLMQRDSWSILEKPGDFLEGWYKRAAEILAEEPGAVWTMRALRAMPNLAHVRIEAQREITDRLFAFYRRILPGVDADALWVRLRLRVEIGWIVDELVFEEDRVDRDLLFHEAARLFDKPMPRPKAQAPKT